MRPIPPRCVDTYAVLVVFFGGEIGINIHQPDLVGPWLQGSMDVNAEHQPGYLTISLFIKK